MDGGSPKPIAFKFRVKQEYEVIIYYEKGLAADSLEEASESIDEDVLDLAFNEEGLVVRTDEEAGNANGYIALVETFDPDIELVYHVEELPWKIEQKLKEKGLL